MSVAAFLECVGDDEELQQALVELAADRGFSFTPDELADSEPGVTAEPRNWQNIAQFPDVAALSSPPADGKSRLTLPEWVNATTVLAATNAVLCGVLAWYLLRDSNRSN
jgi:hypothetical protein